MNKAIFNLPVLLCTALSLAATAVIGAWVFASPDRPTKLLDKPSPVPDFAVTDHNGQAIARQDMLGEVWACDFFLTRCTGVCPALGGRVAELIEALAADPQLNDVRVVSFSVDPEHDTAERLKAYRAGYMGAWSSGDATLKAEIERRWIHTRANDKDAFWKLVSEGFGLYVGESAGDDTTPVAHSSRIVLIDRQGRIRGYYRGLVEGEEDDMPTLIADIRRLVNESKD